MWRKFASQKSSGWTDDIAGNMYFLHMALINWERSYLQMRKEEMFPEFNKGIISFISSIRNLH